MRMSFRSLHLSCFLFLLFVAVQLLGQATSTLEAAKFVWEWKIRGENLVSEVFSLAIGPGEALKVKFDVRSAEASAYARVLKGLSFIGENSNVAALEQEVFNFHESGDGPIAYIMLSPNPPDDLEYRCRIRVYFDFSQGGFGHSPSEVSGYYRHLKEKMAVFVEVIPADSVP